VFLLTSDIKKAPVPVLFLLTFLIVLGSSGCGSAGRSGFTPIRPDPTFTPTGLAGDPSITPTSVVPEQIAVSTYAQTDNRFEIDYPANWQIFERPDGVVFVDPGDQAGYSVVFSDVGQHYSEEELNQYLVTFVAENFLDEESGFSAISQETQANGSVVAQFSSLDPNLGPAINEIRVRQQDSIVFVVLITATEEQWQISKFRLQELADTFIPLDTGPVVQATPTEEPIWLLIGSTTNQFGFLYPSNWIIYEQDENTVRVGMEEYEVTFEGSVSDRDNASGDSQAIAEKTVQAYVDELSKQYENVQSRPAVEFPLGQVTGATVDFLYTTGQGTVMAGSIIAAANEDKIYRTIFTAPAQLYEGALEWFNPMHKSFKILPEDEVIFPGEPGQN
jgi:hypothetical protein